MRIDQCTNQKQPRPWHQRGPSIPRPGSRAAPAQAVEPAILTPAAPNPQQRPAVPERQLPDCRRTPLIRVNCADATAVVALPHACSDCACLPVVPDKLRP